MAQLVVVLLGFCLITNVWVVTGDDNETVVGNDEQLSTTPTAIEEVKDTTNEVLQTDPVAVSEANIGSLIDRSSHFHHLVQDQHLHHHHGPVYHGFWKKKFVWRPRWVKTWQEKKVYVAVWKRMWGPAMINEWVPIPKPPPGWFKHNIGNLGIKTHPY